MVTYIVRVLNIKDIDVMQQITPTQRSISYLLMVLISFLGFFFFSTKASAQNQTVSTVREAISNSVMLATASDNQGGGSPPAGSGSPDRDAVVNCAGDKATCLRDNPLVRWFQIAINVLGAGAAVVVVIMIIAGGIQYSTAGDNPQVIQAAKEKIANAIIALIAFIFLYSFMQWLVPGGIF